MYDELLLDTIATLRLQLHVKKERLYQHELHGNSVQNIDCRPDIWNYTQILQVFMEKVYDGREIGPLQAFTVLNL